MVWEVTTSISGGQPYSAATLEEYTNIARTLTAQSDTMSDLETSWSMAVFELSNDQQASPCRTLNNGTLRTETSVFSGSQHVTLPYAQLIERCTAYATKCRRLGGDLDTLAQLLIRAHSLYSQAENATRSAMNQLLGLATSTFPAQSSVGLGALALGGVIGNSLEEGHINAIGALTSTSWAQEGFMRGISGMLNGRGSKLAAAANQNVNRAAGSISNLSARANDMLQGDVLDVKQVFARTPVVGESRSVSDALHYLKYLGSQRLSEGSSSGLDYATIAIQKYARSDGGSSWLVTIPGTDGQADSPFGWPQNVELMSDDARQRLNADSARMVAQAMEQSGIQSDDPVALIGHSQGGIVAATIASDMNRQYNIQHVVTAGSPIANHPIASSTWVTSVEMDDELVTALDGAANPSTDTWLTIRGHVIDVDKGTAPSLAADGSCIPGTARTKNNPFISTEVADASENKQISHWLGYHEAAYRNASDLGSHQVQEHEEHFQHVIDGELESTTYWRGRMSHGD